MPDDLDKFIEESQKEINENDQKDFSPHALEYARNPYHYGALPHSKNVYSCAWRGPCGDLMHFYLKIENGIIADASFEVDGCATTLMAGSQVIQLIEHQSVAYAWKLQDKDVLKALGKFPEESLHCISLAITTLKRTLVQYKEYLNF